jgi:GntR family transcriptional regulator
VEIIHYVIGWVIIPNLVSIMVKSQHKSVLKDSRVPGDNTMSEKQDQSIYQQVKDTLLAEIARGLYTPGDRFPSQVELCERFMTDRVTVQRVVDEMTDLGVIMAIPGKGLVVVSPKQQAVSGMLISFSDEMKRLGMKATGKVLEKEIQPASTLLARTLGVPVGSELVYLRRLRLGDGKPMAIQVTYLVHNFVPGVFDVDFENASLYEILKNNYKLKFSGASVSVETALANQDDSLLLGMTPPAATLITEQITYLEDGRAIEFARTAFRGDRFKLVMK